MPEKHEDHHILIGALIVTILALIAVLGIFAYQIFYGNRLITVQRIEFDDTLLDDTLEAQQQFVEESINNSIESDEEPPAEEIIRTFQYPGTTRKPSFIYPRDWYTYSSSLITPAAGKLNTLLIDGEPIELEATDGPPAAIVIHTWKVDAQLQNEFETRTEYILDQRKEQNPITQTEQTEGATTTQIQTETEDILIYETANTAIEIYFTETSDTVEAIKASLDFSSIE